jgi:hypothetical protein
LGSADAEFKNAIFGFFNFLKPASSSARFVVSRE